MSVYFKARYMKDGKVRGKSYTFKADFQPKAGDILKTATANIKVVDDPVDMDFVKKWGEDNIVDAQRPEVIEQ